MTNIETLEYAAQLQNTEVGEAWQLLVDISKYSDYLSEEFSKAIDNEIVTQVDIIKNDYEIIEEEVERPKTTYKTLRFKNE